MGATAKLAQWVVGTTYEDMPPAAIQKAEEACFDTMGVMVAGAAEEFARIILRYVSGMGDGGEATVVPHGTRLPAAQAALVNGTYAHILDFDDMGSFGHPSTVLFPAVLALAEKLGVSGKDILEAYVVGCEVGANLCPGGNHGRFNQMKRVFHSTPVFGPIAAACACAKLLKLNEQQTRWAIGIASSMAGGLNGNYGEMTKALHAGMAARDGVMAAELAKDGWTAIENALEHPLGFVAAFFGEDMANPDDLVGNLGNPFVTQGAIILKRYACCGASHTALHSLLSLMQEHGVTYEDVQRVEIDNISYLSPITLYGEVENGLQGKFSMLYTIAAALLHGKVDIASFHDEAVHDPRLKEAMGKVRLNVRSKWGTSAATYIAAGNPVRIHLNDGRVLSGVAAFNQLPGSASNPFSREDLVDKFQANAALALPQARVEEAVHVWGEVRRIEDVRQAIKAVLATG